MQIAEQVAIALYNKGVCLYQMEKNEEEIAVYDELVDRFKDRDEMKIAEQVTNALLNKGSSLYQLGKKKESKIIFEFVIQKYSKYIDNEKHKSIKRLINRSSPKNPS